MGLMDIGDDANFVKALSNYFRRRVAHGGYPDQAIQKTFDLVFDALRALEQDSVKSTHIPIIGAGRIDGPPGQLPPTIVNGAFVSIVFDQAAGTQAVYRGFKIPGTYLSDAAFHIHWTKSDDIDRSGEAVRWVVNYTIFNGSTEDAVAGTETLVFDDTYLDGGTTSRIVQRIANQALVDPQANYYVSVCVEKGTPDAGPTPMAEPALVSVDFTYKESAF